MVFYVTRNFLIKRSLLH